MRKHLLFSMLVLIGVAGCNGGHGAPPPVAVTLSPGAAQAIDQGQSVNVMATVANDSASKGVTWSLSGPGTLTNQTMTSVTYNAPAAGGATGAATVTATSVADTTKTSSVTINVSAPPSITTMSPLPAGTEGTAYSQPIAASGGAGALSFALSGGTTLPAGLTMDASGHITGTPTGPNVATNFTVKVTDSSTAGAQSATQSFSLTINLPPPPSITTTSPLPAGVEGTAYSQPIAATGGLTPYTFTIVVPGTGTLPAGLSMDTSGHITGTPTGPNGASTFTVKVTDSSNPNQSATQNFSLTINLPPPPSITTTSPLPPGTEGTAYNQTIMATGGLTPYTFTITSPTGLPPGLSMDTSGHITGTPTGPPSTTSITVTVTDKSNPPQTASKVLSITINLPPAPTISPTTLPDGNVGTPYSQTLTVSGGLGPFTWMVFSGTLPPGLTLTVNTPTTTATIHGTPTTAQSSAFAFTISVTDTSNPPQTGQQAYTVTIHPPAPLTITTASLANGAFNTPYSQPINAAGGIAPYTFSLDAASSALPAGLMFTNDAAHNQGLISGTPTTAGMFPGIIVDVTDSEVPPMTAKSPAYSLTITAPAVVISPASGALPAGTQNTAYSQTITVTGGVSPYTFSLDAASTALPPGLMLTPSASSATISGTPTVAATTNGIIVDVKDSEQPPVTTKVTYSITINPANNNAKLNGDFAFQFTGFVDSGGEVAMAGRFHADGNGNLTNGVLDSNGATGVAHLTFAGTYTVTVDNRCTLVAQLITGARTFKCVLLVSPTDTRVGRIIEFDDASGTGTRGSGEIHVQTLADASFSVFNGDFALGFFGDVTINTGTGPANGRVGVVGRVTLATMTAAATSPFSAGFVDVSVPGTSFSSTLTGQLNAPDAGTGHGTGSLTLTIAPLGVNLTLNFAYYVVGKHQAFIVSTSTPATNVPLLSGFVQKQRLATFTAASITGPFVFANAGICGSPNTTTAQAVVGVGRMVSDGNGTFTTGTFDENECGTIVANTSITGTYMVDPDPTHKGRVTVNLTSVVSPKPQMGYLYDINKGFVLEGTATTPGNEVTFGIITPQVAPTGGFSEANLAGTYGLATVAPASSAVPNMSGVTTLTSSATPPSTLSGTTDVSLPPPGATLLFPDAAISGGTYTLTDSTVGRFTATFTAAGVTFNFAIYQVAPGGFIAVEVTTGNPGSAGIFFEQ